MNPDEIDIEVNGEDVTIIKDGVYEVYKEIRCEDGTTIERGTELTLTKIHTDPVRFEFTVVGEPERTETLSKDTMEKYREKMHILLYHTPSNHDLY